MATLISQVSKLNRQKKSTQIMFRCSESFKSLLGFWVKQSNSKGYSDFIRKLVLSATAERKDKKKQLTPILKSLKKELENNE